MSDLHMALWIALALMPEVCHQPLVPLSPHLLVHTLRVARTTPKWSGIFPPMLADVMEALSPCSLSLKPLDAFPTHGPGGRLWPPGA